MPRALPAWGAASQASSAYGGSTGPCWALRKAPGWGQVVTLVAAPCPLPAPGRLRDWQTLKGRVAWACFRVNFMFSRGVSSRRE